tara:strand:+ start:126 stop:278 length:153 start_codon:yes stop_codon:yes gene_type:complete
VKFDPKKGVFQTNGENRYSKLHNSIKYGIGAWNSNQFYKNRWKQYHPGKY